MHVTKIKIKQEHVFIEYDQSIVVQDEELLNKYSIDSPEQPVGEFKKAFQAMDFFLIELCELCEKPKDIPIMCEDVNITGLSFKYKDGSLSSAIITGTKQLAYSNSPLVLNTPNKSVNIDDEFNKMVHLTDPCIAGFKSVIDHAKNYIGGERLQIELPLKDGVADKKTEANPNEGKGDEKVQETVSRETTDSADQSEIPKKPKTSDVED